MADVTVEITDTESDYVDEDQGFEDYAVGLTFTMTVDAECVRQRHVRQPPSTTLGDEDDSKTSSTDTSDDTDVELEFPISVE